MTSLLRRLRNTVSDGLESLTSHTPPPPREINLETDRDVQDFFDRDIALRNEIDSRMAKTGEIPWPLIDEGMKATDQFCEDNKFSFEDLTNKVVAEKKKRREGA